MPKTPKKSDAAEATYPKLNALWRADEKSLTFAEAKKYLGWREDTPEEKFTEYDLELPNGRRVVFDNNRKNRPWDNMQLKVLKQEHLNRNWRMNPDGIGIGMYGSIMSGQHRLRSFCEAEIERLADEAKWGADPLVMPCIVLVGLDESDETFRILNTGAPATASDAFYRQGLFPKQVKNNRVTLCKMLESEIKCLWVRTGANKDGYSPERTNSEVVDFYERHPKTADCVLHVFEEYASGKGHAQRMGPGSLAAMMYLMATSATPDRVKYTKKPCDKSLDWSLFDKASDFVTMLCKGDGEFEAVRSVLDSLCSDDDPLAGLYTRKLVITKAWNLFRGGEKITEDGIVPKTVTDEETGVRSLDEFPDFGGIDLNEGVGAIQSEKADAPVTEEEVEAAKQEIADEKEPEAAAPVAEPVTKDDKERALIAKLRVEHRNKVLLFKTKKELLVWEEDAILLSKLIPSIEVKTFVNGMKYVGWPLKKQVDLLGKLKAAKKKSVFVTIDKDENAICTDPDTGNPI